ncbi:MAG: TolC family protein [Desulfuromonadales bacterium]|nr:TolC family protein [Desulfuromonadales bacterium]
MKIIQICTVVILLLMPLSRPLAAAADADLSPLRLSLSEAVALAWAEHPAMTLARNRQESADVSLQAARGSFLPDLQASASASERYAQQPPGGDDGDYRTMTVGLSSRFNLYNGFADAAALDGSRIQLNAATADLLRQQQTIALNAATAFIMVLSDRELVAAAEENLAREEALLEQVDAFYRSGLRSVTDFYQQRAARAQAELDLLDARRNLDVAQLQLLQNLGQQPPRDVELLPIDPFALVEPLRGLDLTASINQALLQRPDLLAAQRQVEMASAGVTEARSGYLPRLDLVASADSGYSSLNGGRNLGAQLSRDRGSAAIGLNLSVPIFDRFQTKSSVSQAEISVRNAVVEVMRLQQLIGVEVGQALADYRRAELQTTVSRTQLDAARQALEAAEARYRAGAASWVDRAAARASFVSSQATEVQARHALLQQGLAVGHARGDLQLLLARLTPGKESE